MKINNKSYIINASFDSKYKMITAIPLFLPFFILGAAIMFKTFLGLALIIISIRLYPYQFIDLLFSKEIKIEDNDITLEIVGIKFPLSKENSYINIDSSFILASDYAQLKTLRICRNPPKYYQRLFKNKIKLNVVIKSNIEEMKQEAMRISEITGIRFIDDFDID